MFEDESVCVALGSNVGDRAATLDAAIRSLDAHQGVKILKVSSYHETEPVGIENQPRFLNAAATLACSLSPKDTLSLLLEVEREHGRTRNVDDRWGPRTIDLDLLLYADHIIDQPGLVVPHPLMHTRRFVLDPLVEIAPQEIHPVFNASIQALRQRLLAEEESFTTISRTIE